jgi:hypothetical protein
VTVRRNSNTPSSFPGGVSVVTAFARTRAFPVSDRTLPSAATVWKPLLALCHTGFDGWDRSVTRPGRLRPSCATWFVSITPTSSCIGRAKCRDPVHGLRLNQARRGLRVAETDAIRFAMALFHGFGVLPISNTIELWQGCSLCFGASETVMRRHCSWLENSAGATEAGDRRWSTPPDKLTCARRWW